ncbi:MAG: RNA-binding protein [Chitinophagales bacterium]|nr:RNA-binding protein [Bacteroidota bacterium]
MNIFVANIERKVTDEQLQELFSQYGEISSLKLIKDRDTGLSKGYAFIEMPNDDEASQAIAELNQKELNGRALAVNEARPKEEYKKPSFNRGGGGGYNKGGYSNDNSYKKRY